MIRRDLLRWQWESYPEFHKDRMNLLIHLVAVPGFAVSSVLFAGSLLTGRFVSAAVAAAAMAAAFGAQGAGHKRELAPPIPFDGSADIVTRIVSEQFVTFPRFVVSGKWTAAFRGGHS